jgi:hypothetical protein
LLAEENKDSNHNFLQFLFNNENFLKDTGPIRKVRPGAQPLAQRGNQQNLLLANLRPDLRNHRQKIAQELQTGQIQLYDPQIHIPGLKLSQDQFFGASRLDSQHQLAIRDQKPSRAFQKD